MPVMNMKGNLITGQLIYQYKKGTYLICLVGEEIIKTIKVIKG